MMTRLLGRTGIAVSTLGLGCSRLGSVMGADPQVADALIRAALDCGVTYFDTSDLYGQGDSERLLGRALAGRTGAIICTKVGKRHSLVKRILTPLKGPIAALTRGARGAATVVTAARGQPVPVCFEPAYLNGALRASRKRLGVERLDGVMLHSPGAEVLRRGEAVGVLAELKAAGEVGFIGVSVDDSEAGQAALSDDRVEVIQAPLRPGEAEWAAFVEQAGARVGIVAREVLGGHGRRFDDGAIGARLKAAIDAPGISTVLLGTTNPTHLAQAIDSISHIS